MNKFRKEYISSAAITLTVLLVSIALYFAVLVPQNPFMWDEGVRATHGLNTALALQHMDIRRFFGLTLGAVGYPGVHPFFLGIILSIFGKSILVAKTASLLSFFATAIVLYFLGRSLARQWNWFVGAVGVFLLLTSPLILFTSTTAMVEPLALLLSLLTLLLYFKGISSGDAKYHVLTGILVAIVFLTRHVFGVFLAVTFLSVAIIESLGNLRKITRIRTSNETSMSASRLTSGNWLPKKHLALIAIFSFVIVLWLLLPTSLSPTDKLSAIFGIAGRNINQDIMGLSLLDRLLFYPRSLATAYTFSAWTFVIMVVALFASLPDLKNQKLQALVILFFVTLIYGTYQLNQQDRYIHAAVPSLFLISASQTERVILFIKQRQKWIAQSAALGSVLFLLLIGDLLQLPSFIKPVANYTTRGAVFFDEYAETIDFRPPFLWGLSRRPDFLMPVGNYVNVDAQIKNNVRESTSSLLDYIAENTPVSQRTCILASLNELSPDYTLWYLSSKLISTSVDKVEPDCAIFVTIEVLPSSPYYTADFRGTTGSSTRFYNTELKEQKQIYHLQKEKDFEDLGLILRLYSRAGA